MKLGNHAKTIINRQFGEQIFLTYTNDLTTISSSTLNTTCMINKLFQVSAKGQLSNDQSQI